jgi:NAD(P)-dependent dehydrogenase (short-subunit alcohol dehydrogenase family)
MLAGPLPFDVLPPGEKCVDTMSHVVAITGATSGIGRAAALELAESASKLILLVRDEKRGGEVCSEIARATGDPDRAEVIRCDLASLQSVRVAASRLLSRYARLDVLVANAGVYARAREVTVDEHELTWQVNHLSHFLLANLLRPALASAAPSRLVIVSSGAHVVAWRGIRHDDPEMARGWGSFPAYAHAKLAEVMFGLAAGRRWAVDGIASNVVHPGHVATNLYSAEPTLAERIQASLVRQQTPEQGADTVVWLASSLEVSGDTGGYYHDRKLARASRVARDLKGQERLWRLSAEATGLPTD